MALGVIRIIIKWIWLPSIELMLIPIFYDTFKSIGMSPFLLALFVVASLIIMVVAQWKEWDNLKTQIKKNNWW